MADDNKSNFTVTDQTGDGEGTSPDARQPSYTREELAVLQECRVNSFFYRALPMSIANMFTVHLAIKNGYASPNRQFLKIAGAGFFGYFLGKASYMNTCRAKLMALENSPLAARLREQEKRTMDRYQDATRERQTDKSEDAFYQQPQDQQAQNLPGRTALRHSMRNDGGPDRNTDMNLAYSDAPPDSGQQTPKQYTSYEDLRRRRQELRKREEYRAILKKEEQDKKEKKELHQAIRQQIASPQQQSQRFNEYGDPIVDVDPETDRRSS